MKEPKKIIDPATARAKVEHFCAYQERSQHEVRDKLYSYGLHSNQVEELISGLIQGNFINEERFAYAYTLGKFRIKHWGKNKIKHGLRLKRVPEKLITKALVQIDDEEYMKTLKILIEKKSELTRQTDILKRRNMLFQYAIGKGYEKELISNLLYDND